MNINIDQIKAKANQKANNFIANIKFEDFAELVLEIGFIAYFTLKIAAIVIWQNRQEIIKQVKKAVVAIIEALLVVITIFMIFSISFTEVVNNKIIPAVKRYILKIDKAIQFYFCAG